MSATKSELERLFQGEGAHASARHIVFDVREGIRDDRPAGAPHSIAEELWHIVFWQDHCLQWARGVALDYPARAELGWKLFAHITTEEWNELVARFDAGLRQAASYAGDSGMLNRFSTLKEPGAEVLVPTVSEVLVGLAVHNAYHLGRIVFLRQLLHEWPPRGGGDTW